MFDNISAVIINFQTPDLLRVAVESFRYYYPQVELLIIDNGSKDNSPRLIREFEKSSPLKTKVLFMEQNIYHGPAMHQALRILDKKFIFFLDSDTETKKGGFLEEMYNLLDVSEKNYGIGKQFKVNKRGFISERGINILAPAYMMLRRSIYFTLPQFEHHGQPVMKNFFAAHKTGYQLISFPIENFIEHHWRGTASRFGYGLGFKGKVDFILNKIGL